MSAVAGKITLDFRRVSQEQLEGIAAATCGAAAAAGLRAVFLAENLKRMCREKDELAGMLHEGAQNIDEINTNLRQIVHAINDLENVTPSALGGAGSHGVIEARISSLGQQTGLCDSASRRLGGLTSQVRHMLEEKARRDAKVYEEAQLLEADGGSQTLYAQVMNFRKDFEDHSSKAATFCVEAKAVCLSAENIYNRVHSLINDKRAQLAAAEAREACRRREEAERRHYESRRPAYSAGNGW